MPKSWRQDAGGTPEGCRRDAGGTPEGCRGDDRGMTARRGLLRYRRGAPRVDEYDFYSPLVA